MPIGLYRDLLGRWTLTPGSKEILEAIRQAMEYYYFNKFADIGDPFEPIGPSPGPEDRGGEAGYTPNPEDPDPWPWPWWRVDTLDRLIDIATGRIGQIGAVLGDPAPRTDIAAEIKSSAFHLRAAEAALEKMESAQDQLKANIEQLQGQQ